MFKQTENERGWVKLYAKLITKVINPFNEIISVMLEIKHRKTE